MRIEAGRWQRHFPRIESSSAKARSCPWALRDAPRCRGDLDRVSRVDIALGVGGLPRGRVVEIYGPESSGKTTLTLQVIAETQKNAAAWPHISTPSTRWIRSYAQKLG